MPDRELHEHRAVHNLGALPDWAADWAALQGQTVDDAAVVLGLTPDWFVVPDEMYLALSEGDHHAPAADTTADDDGESAER